MQLWALDVLTLQYRENQGHPISFIRAESDSAVTRYLFLWTLGIEFRTLQIISMHTNALSIIVVIVK